MPPDDPFSSNAPRRTIWLSRGLESLVEDKPWTVTGAPPSDGRSDDFDVVIVGSGYGGAVAAAAVSGCTDAGGNRLRVCGLERGHEYLAGMFPPRIADLAGPVRFATSDAYRQRRVHDRPFGLPLS